MGAALLSQPEKIKEVKKSTMYFSTSPLLVQVIVVSRLLKYTCRNKVQFCVIQSTFEVSCEIDVIYLPQYTDCLFQILTTLVNGLSVPVTCKVRILPEVN